VDRAGDAGSARMRVGIYTYYETIDDEEGAAQAPPAESQR
jgi:hypothetical protein